MSFSPATVTRDQRGRQALQLPLGVIAGSDAAIGAFAAITPHAFSRHVVGVDLLGPYNEHLLRDIGCFSCAKLGIRSRTQLAARLGASA